LRGVSEELDLDHDVGFNLSARFFTDRTLRWNAVYQRRMRGSPIRIEYGKAESIKRFPLFHIPIAESHFIFPLHCQADHLPGYEQNYYKHALVT
jgi:hypothetical protein